MSRDAREPPADGDLRVLVRERELAERWRVSRRTLQRWRAAGRGPAHLLIGGLVRYQLTDVLAFETRMRRGGDTS